MVGGQPATCPRGRKQRKYDTLDGTHRRYTYDEAHSLDLGSMSQREYASMNKLRDAHGMRRASPPRDQHEFCGPRICYLDPVDGEKLSFSAVVGGGCRYKVKGEWWRPVFTTAELKRDTTGLFLYFRELDRGVSVTARAVEELVQIFDESGVKHNIDTFDELQIAIRKANYNNARAGHHCLQRLPGSTAPYATQVTEERNFLGEAEARYNLLVAQQGALSVEHPPQPALVVHAPPAPIPEPEPKPQPPPSPPPTVPETKPDTRPSSPAESVSSKLSARPQYVEVEHFERRRETMHPTHTQGSSTQAASEHGDASHGPHDSLAYCEHDHRHAYDRRFPPACGFHREGSLQQEVRDLLNKGPERRSSHLSLPRERSRRWDSTSGSAAFVTPSNVKLSPPRGTLTPHMFTD